MGKNRRVQIWMEDWRFQILVKEKKDTGKSFAKQMLEARFDNDTRMKITAIHDMVAAMHKEHLARQKRQKG